jgi:asparagine synthase (glutamine-hydrolysing)
VLPSWLRRGVIAPFTRLIPDRLSPRSRLRQMKKFARSAELGFAQRYTGWMTYVDADLKHRLYTAGFAGQLGSLDQAYWLRELLLQQQRRWREPIDQLLATDVRSYLPFDLLVKMDIATMANSLEARSPFLDTRVMEFAAQLHPSLKIRGRTLKYLAKRAAARFFPADLLHRRKMGFGVPIGTWLRADMRPLLEDILLGSRSLQRGYFEPATLRALVHEHQHGYDRTNQLWALLWLELWHQEFLDGTKPASNPRPSLFPEQRSAHAFATVTPP